jgi:hypothetical protein
MQVVSKDVQYIAAFSYSNFETLLIKIEQIPGVKIVVSVIRVLMANDLGFVSGAFKTSLIQTPTFYFTGSDLDFEFTSTVGNI